MYKRHKRVQYRILFPFLIRTLNFLFKKKQELTGKKLDPAPFFIIGSGRNGSTLFSAMLNNNPRIFIPPEQYVLPYAIMERQLFRHFSKKKLVESLIDKFSKEKNTSNWSVDFERLRESIFKNDISNWDFRKLIDYIFRFYGEQLGNSDFIWGERTPLSTHFVPLIYEFFPNAKYIFLVRDPRDVILSYSKMDPSHPASNLKVAAWKWNDSVLMYDWLKKRVKNEKLLKVKYENLVSKPKQETQIVSEFLGVRWTEAMLDHRDQVVNMGVSGKAIHSNLNNSINPKSVGKWKRELNKEKVEKVEILLSDNMNRFGYH